jgi:hypothetical protein
LFFKNRMGDNNGDWDVAASKGDKKKAAKAAAAAKAQRNQEIAQMKDLVQKIFNSGSPVQYQEVKMKTINALKAMGENVSGYERREESRLVAERAASERAARKREQNAQMAKNKEKVEKHFGPLAGHKVNMMRMRLETRWMGQKMTPSNANIYAELAKEANQNIAHREAADRYAHREWQASMEREYPEWYNMKPRRAPPPRYNARNYGRAAEGYSDDYGSAAQGGPAPRNNWQRRAARGAYEEWKPAAAAEPAMYPILGIPVTASEGQIKAAYKEKIIRGPYRHPNKGGDTEEFKKLQKEYESALASLGAEGGRRKTRRARSKRSKTRKNRS